MNCPDTIIMLIQTIRSHNYTTRGQPMLETIVVLILLVLSLGIITHYVPRGVGARARLATEAVSFGGLYKGTGAVNCDYDPDYGWYNGNCFESSGCGKKCLGQFATHKTCGECIAGCATCDP